MTNPRYDVIALGNAIMDVIASVDDAFLESNDIPKARMSLIDQERTDFLYNALPDTKVETSGGSAGNSIACLLSLGAKAAFMGKVADDEIGTAYVSDMERIGATFSGKPLTSGISTARCMIAVTPDGERSMNTFLGASTEFEADDVDEDLIRDSKWLYLEGYLFDKPAAKTAFVRAAEVAKAANRKVAVTMSDVFCVERHREAFRHLVKNYVDLVFANEEELLALYETDDFDAAVDMLKTETQFAAITRSEKGSVVIDSNTRLNVPTKPLDKVVDATGAGDAYAGGFFFGLSQGLNLETCARLGHLSASEVISHYGPRPETNLRELAIAEGLISA
ncbi:adenosine kinase [Hirschia baltica]|uniref:PfkB domain protein n=1 Tax=Hirschia baltica (strain ATCC 49814 / DSM 5838 / IFAM 1418) TaxID=582402 RepID=C6XIH7_HIRBI|nr:adenosine kinase [Hirschia baltica]ACT60784.1 PfkB domain protein [Hirschia baltica ATCC 49814]